MHMHVCGGSQQVICEFIVTRDVRNSSDLTPQELQQIPSVYYLPHNSQTVQGMSTRIETRW